MDATCENAEFPTIDAALADSIHHAENDGISLEAVLERLGPASFCFACLLLSVPFLQPIPLGPYSMAGGITFIACGWQMALGRKTPLLPKRMKAARLHGKGWVVALRLCQRLLGWGRKITRRRKEEWVSGRAGEKIVGGCILAAGALLALPAMQLPLNNFFPALAIVFAALAWLERDGFMLVLSAVAMALSVAYFVTVGLLFWFFGEQIFAWIHSAWHG